MMKVLNAGIFSKPQRQGPRTVDREVFQVNALTTINVEIGSAVSLNFNNIPFYFKVITKEVQGQVLNITLEETGFWVKKITHVHKNLDPRELLDLDLTIITDTDLINKLQKESKYT